MAQFVDVVVDAVQQGGAPVVEVADKRGGAAPAEKARGKSEPTGPLTVHDDTHAVASAGRVLKDSTREKINALVRAQADAAPADDDEDAEVAEPDAEASDDAEPAADTAADDEDDDEVVDAAATPSEPKPPAKAVAPSDVEARLQELEGITERQRAALERYEKDLEAARKGGEETAAQREARLEAAESGYLGDPIKALYKFVATGMGHDDENHEDVKKEVMDLFLDLTAHVSGATQDQAHQAKRQSDRTRREWEREKKSRAAGGKKDAEAAAQRQREQQVEGIVGEIEARLRPDAAKYPHLTSLAPLLDGKSAGRVVWDVIERGIARGDFKADEPDDVLLAKASKAAEDFYTKRADPIRAAITPKTTSTATPTVAKKATPAAPVEREKPRTSKEARVTNADASVAPATPPAKKPAPKAIPLQNDEARRKHALRFLRQKK
jgi:hypothetical protein